MVAFGDVTPKRHLSFAYVFGRYRFERPPRSAAVFRTASSAATSVGEPRHLILFLRLHRWRRTNRDISYDTWVSRMKHE